MRLTIKQKTVLEKMAEKWFIWCNKSGKLFLCNPNSEISGESENTGFPVGNEYLETVIPIDFRTIRSLIANELIAQDTNNNCWYVTNLGLTSINYQLPEPEVQIQSHPIEDESKKEQYIFSILDSLIPPPELNNLLKHMSEVDNSFYTAFTNMAIGHAATSGKPEDREIILTFICMYMIRWYSGRLQQITGYPVEMTFRAFLKEEFLDALKRGAQDSPTITETIAPPIPKNKTGVVGNKELEKLMSLLDDGDDIDTTL